MDERVTSAVWVADAEHRAFGGRRTGAAERTGAATSEASGHVVDRPGRALVRPELRRLAEIHRKDGIIPFPQHSIVHEEISQYQRAHLAVTKPGTWHDPRSACIPVASAGSDGVRRARPANVRRPQSRMYAVAGQPSGLSTASAYWAVTSLMREWAFCPRCWSAILPLASVARDGYPMTPVGV